MATTMTHHHHHHHHNHQTLEVPKHRDEIDMRAEQSLTEESSQDVDIEYEDDESDPDSSESGSDCDCNASDTTSIESEIREYIYENGRRYHASSYPLPNDEVEQDRLDLIHHLFLMILGGELHCAPWPERTRRVLDIGTGTGIWAIDIADKHPDVEVIGVDLSPIQPTWAPSNCTFEVDDIEEEWTWNEPFDFIHSRCMAQAIQDWSAFLDQAFENLVPGGTIALVEPEIALHTEGDPIEHDSPIDIYFRNLKRALDLAGTPDPVHEIEGYLRQAGFVDITVRVEKCAWGTWSEDRVQKELGRWCLAVCESGLQAYALACFTRVLGMAGELAEDIINSALKELKESRWRAYGDMYFFSARKPGVHGEGESDDEYTTASESDDFEDPSDGEDDDDDEEEVVVRQSEILKPRPSITVDTGDRDSVQQSMRSLSLAPPAKKASSKYDYSDSEEEEEHDPSTPATELHLPTIRLTPSAERKASESRPALRPKMSTEALDIDAFKGA